MKLLVTRRSYWYLVYTCVFDCILNNFMPMLDNRMIIEVFLFLSVFDKWKSAMVIVVISPWRSSILRRVENPNMCVRVSCAVASDIFWDHGAESFFKISHDIPRILWEAKTHYRVHKVPILSQMKPVHALRSYFFKTRFNIIPPVTFMGNIFYWRVFVLNFFVWKSVFKKR